MDDLKSFREQSRRDLASLKEGNPTNEEIQLGAILRMADATELMASNYTQLQKDREGAGGIDRHFRKRVLVKPENARSKRP